MGDSLASLIVGTGGLFLVLFWGGAIVFTVALPFMAFAALRHLKSIRQSLEQLARSAELADARASGPTDWSKPTVVGGR